MCKYLINIYIINIYIYIVNQYVWLAQLVFHKDPEIQDEPHQHRWKKGKEKLESKNHYTKCYGVLGN